MSGNGPQFDSGEMREFAKSYNFTHVTTVRTSVPQVKKTLYSPVALPE